MSTDQPTSDQDHEQAHGLDEAYSGTTAVPSPT
jgi:hypothetical protein